MVEPATIAGSKTALGVICPVLPTVNIMSVNLVKTSSAGNLYAVAHFGYFAVNPNSFFTLLFIDYNSLKNCPVLPSGVI